LQLNVEIVPPDRARFPVIIADIDIGEGALPETLSETERVPLIVYPVDGSYQFVN